MAQTETAPASKLDAILSKLHGVVRQSLVFLNVPALQQPEVYIANAAKLFDESGALTDASTKDFLLKFLQAFAQWIERIIAK